MSNRTRWQAVLVTLLLATRLAAQDHPHTTAVAEQTGSVHFATSCRPASARPLPMPSSTTLAPSRTSLWRTVGVEHQRSFSPIMSIAQFLSIVNTISQVLIRISPIGLIFRPLNPPPSFPR